MANEASEVWSHLARQMESTSVPAAAANAALLRRVSAVWSERVDARSSMFDLLFTAPGATYPFPEEVRVSWADGVFSMAYFRRGLIVSGDKCESSASSAVLAALLVQLVGGET